MPGVDPLANLNLITALDLGVPVPVLQAQISIGDLLTATVLAPQNGMDLIEILGQQVAAQLPPDVRPGETLVLQVTGFTSNQILVRNLGQADPQNPAPTVNLTLRTSNAPSATSTQGGAPAARENAASAGSAARIIANAPSVILSAPGTIVNARGSAGSQQRVNQALPSAAPGPVDHVNARIAAAQTTSQAVPQKPLPTQTSSVPSTSRQSPPQIPVHAQVRSAVAQIAQRVVHTVGDLLKVLRIPDTPLTRTAAAIAPQAPVRLPSVLHRLESALPRESSDPRVATLKTLLAFTARINPANEETLPTQLSSYVSHVVEGAEPKVSQLLQALAQTQEQDVPAQSPPPTQHDRTAEPPVPSPAHLVSQAVSHAASHARAAERVAAIEHDLKSVVLSLLRDPGATRTPALNQALNETFITLTAVQLNVLSSNTQSPGTLSLTLPVFYHEDGKPAQIRISKDAQSRAGKLDADNFHIAFVLDTAHLGTVAIDLQTSGRTVKIDVKTEAEKSASRFTQSLDSLRKRLEVLRYRVGSTAVSALNRTGAGAAVEQSADANSAGASNLDLRA